MPRAFLKNLRSLNSLQSICVKVSAIRFIIYNISTKICTSGFDGDKLLNKVKSTLYSLAKLMTCLPYDYFDKDFCLENL